MNGTTVTEKATVAFNPTIRGVAGVADFNGDGHADVLPRGQDGQLFVWEMIGALVTDGGAVAINPTNYWNVAGTGDFYGDGHADMSCSSTKVGRPSPTASSGSSASRWQRTRCWPPAESAEADGDKLCQATTLAKPPECSALPPLRRPYALARPSASRPDAPLRDNAPAFPGIPDARLSFARRRCRRLWPAGALCPGLRAGLTMSFDLWLSAAVALGLLVYLLVALLRPESL